MVKSRRLKDIRNDIIRNLQCVGNDSPNADANLLLENILNVNKTDLIIGERKISDNEAELIYSAFERLKNGEPIQYVVGKCEFMSLVFNIGKGVLIPRADTEILVETTLDFCEGKGCLSVLDLCCGSGCIGISLAKYNKNLSVTLLDISDDALYFATVNAKNNLVDDRCEIKKLDVLSEKIEKEYDLIVSNPPYIEREVIKSLDEKVKCFEPDIALDGGVDGLDFYRRISKTSSLKKGGALAFEIGYNQGKSVCNIMKEYGFLDVKIIKDIENRDRVVLGIKN